jgi:hypothetical protein
MESITFFGRSLLIPILPLQLAAVELAALGQQELLERLAL